MNSFKNPNGRHVVSFIILSTFISFGCAKLVDDSDSSIIYSPTWAVGNTCDSCLAEPNVAYVYQHTWHDNFRSPGSSDGVYFQYSFTGTGIEVYGIISNESDRQNTFITRYDLVFTLNGVIAGTFVHGPSGENNYLYGQKLFSTQNLSNGEHTVRVELNQGSAMLFDYMVVTEADGEPDTDSGGSSSTINSPNNTPSTGSVSTSDGSSTGSITRLTTVNGPALGITFATFSAPGDSTASDTLQAASGLLTASNNTHSLSKPTIVGITFAILTLSLLFGFLAFFLWRKRYRNRMHMEGVDPFTIPSSSEMTQASLMSPSRSYSEVEAQIGGTIPRTTADATGRRLVGKFRIPANTNGQNDAGRVGPQSEISHLPSQTSPPPYN